MEVWGDIFVGNQRIVSTYHVAKSHSWSSVLNGQTTNTSSLYCAK